MNSKAISAYNPPSNKLLKVPIISPKVHAEDLLPVNWQMPSSHPIKISVNNSEYDMFVICNRNLVFCTKANYGKTEENVLCEEWWVRSKNINRNRHAKIYFVKLKAVYNSNIPMKKTSFITKSKNKPDISSTRAINTRSLAPFV